ncbi:hypothetical protein BCT54_19540 [Vibrio splendidus]|uniref:DUF2726 domain-containing protein n=2 Tax=Vibrionaceae TaxID=641 RepID=A0A2N7JTX0_VIBSP|nr:hypothetical protein BCT54_19540 [Vibrio splendidus]
MIVVGFGYVFFYPKKKNGRHYTKTSKNYPTSQKPIERKSHLDVVSYSDYSTSKLMNSGEFRLYSLIKRIVEPEYLVFPQVALGEVLSSNTGHQAINAKRVDLMIFNKSGHAVVAVEFNGRGKNGHFQGDYEDRDAIKRLALTKAGVYFLPVEKIEERELRFHLEKAGVLKSKSNQAAMS